LEKELGKRFVNRFKFEFWTPNKIQKNPTHVFLP
jgi:hypothetical protein